MNSRTSSSPSRRPSAGISLGSLARYWRGAVAVWGGVTLIGVVVAFVLPAVYESVSVVETRASGPGAPAPATLEQTVRSLSADTQLLTGLARSAEVSDESLDQALDKARAAISITRRPDGAFRIAFGARHPESAQRGCQELTRAVTRVLTSSNGNTSPDALLKQADLEQKTRDLAVFVSTHPDVMGESAGPRPVASARPDPRALEIAAQNDPTMIVLRQEKKRLETELAARAAPAAPAPSSVFGPNPYDEPQAGSDAQTIQRRLGELRLAISAHQRAVIEKTAASDSRKQEPEAKDAPVLRAEWRRLVQAVVDAQKSMSTAAPPALEARIVEPPSLPSRPIKPNRLLVSVVGALAGLWSSLVIVLLRARKRENQKGVPRRRVAAVARPPAIIAPAALPAARSGSDPPRTRTLALGSGAPNPVPTGAPIVPSVIVPPQVNEPHLARTLEVAEPKSTSPTAFANTVPSPVPPPPPVVAESTPPPPPKPSSDPPRAAPRPSSNPPGRTSSNPPARASSNPPRQANNVTRRISNYPPPKADPTPAVTANSETLRPPPREDARASVPPGPPRRTISPPPVAPAPVRHDAHGDDSPNTRRIGSPEQASLQQAMLHASSAPPGERPDTSYSIVDKSRRSSRKPEPSPEQRRLSDRGTRPLTTDPTGVLKPVSDPPRVHSSTLPSDRPRAGVHGATRPGWAIPSPPPVAARGEVVRTPSAPPAKDEDVIRPLSVPPSWRPPPPQPEPEPEIAQLRDQILAQRGAQCFVVGVTSDADALPAKSALAVRLSMLLAESPARVLVMEANFDFPAVHRVLGIDMPRLAGFSQQVHARIRTGEHVPWKVVRCTANLHVLGEGFMRSPGVAFSREFSDAISELRRTYDFIVADGPTASAGADCKPLNSFADGLVVAVRPGAKLEDAIERAARWFTRKELMAAVFVDVK